MKRNPKPEPKRNENGNLMKGLACLSKKRRCEIASKGGLAVAKRKGYMAELGRRGGLK